MSDQENTARWVCGRCNVPLVTSKVAVSYLDNSFPVELAQCPICGQAFVPENLALGRMAEVEKTLEDK